MPGRTHDRLRDQAGREPWILRLDQRRDPGNEGRRRAGPAADNVGAARSVSDDAHPRCRDDHGRVAFREVRTLPASVDRRDGDDPSEGCGVLIRGEAGPTRPRIACRGDDRDTVGDGIAKSEPDAPGGGGTAERCVDHIGTMPHRILDSGRDRIVVRGILVVDQESGLLVIQDDPDREDLRLRRYPDHSLPPARSAAMAGDDRADICPVQVRRPVPGRVRARGVVWASRDRPSQVPGAGVGTRVEDRDRDTPSFGHVPGGRHVDGV